MSSSAVDSAGTPGPVDVVEELLAENRRLVGELRRGGSRPVAAVGARGADKPGPTTPRPWLAYFTIHGDPMIVPAERPWPTSRIADIDTSPPDYGRANAELIATSVNAFDAVSALIEQARKVSPSPAMTIYVGDLEQALGLRPEPVRGIVGAES